MTKRNTLKILFLALSVGIFVPIWGTFHNQIGVERGWIAFVSAAIFFAAGHKLKDIGNVIMTHLVGIIWGVASLMLLNSSTVKDGNTVLMSFLILSGFGVSSVLVTNIGIKFISHTPSLFSGWAIAFAILGGTINTDKWSVICIDAAIAIVIGVIFIGVGISQLQHLLIKLFKVKDVEEDTNVKITKQNVSVEISPRITTTEQKIEKYTKHFSSYSESSNGNYENQYFKNGVDDLKSEIINLKDSISTYSKNSNNMNSDLNNVKVKIIGVCGSPHKNGSTIKYLRRALEAAESIGNVETEIIELTGKDIKPCMGCKSDKCYGTCRINDVMQDFYPKLRDCDGIILGSPSYFGTFTAQLKIFIDRLRVMRHTNFELCNKVIGTLSVAGRRHGGQELTNVDIMQSMMRHNTILVNDGTAVCQLGATGWSHTFDDPNVKSEDDEYGMQTAEGVGKRVAEISKVIKASGLQRTIYEYDSLIGKR